MLGLQDYKDRVTGHTLSYGYSQSASLLSGSAVTSGAVGYGWGTLSACSLPGRPFFSLYTLSRLLRHPPSHTVSQITTPKVCALLALGFAVFSALHKAEIGYLFI